MFFKRKKKEIVVNYKLAFCEDSTIESKFGEYEKGFETLESAKWAIESKANGWGNNIGKIENGAYEILNDFGYRVSWIIIIDKEGNRVYE